MVKIVLANLVGMFAAYALGAEAQKIVAPVTIGETKEACRIIDGKLEVSKDSSWESCSRGLLQVAVNLEKQRDACLAPKSKKSLPSSLK